jgi:hypothetical protein
VSQDGTPDPREPGSTGEPTQPTEWVLPADGQSRRHFLRNALIGSAAAAAVVGGGAAVAATPLGPRLISQIKPAAAVASPTCIQIVEGSKGNDSNSNHFLEVLPADQPKIPDGSCIVLTAKSGNAPPFKTNVLSHQQKQNSTHELLCICPPIPNNPGMDEYPSGSTICLSTDCPPETGCLPCTQ